ncbi:hypothetical protein TD95_000796 [Thielaviopsis punctulata]|uniref:EthD domain-containing protein n=1 Tax=Thielaviopsis punctulata TaxID=72032 RepID=A0A0F4ZKZ7_9PEZI|nr:hypothetical protein TD95_000796 [Thielaviopsis punctulata]
MASYNVTVAYDTTPGASFDMDYYLSKHMPLVESLWKPAGLLSYKVVELDLSSPDALPPLQVLCVMTWKDEASFKAAVKTPAATTIFDDVPKFTTIPAKVYTGKIY